MWPRILLIGFLNVAYGIILAQTNANPTPHKTLARQLYLKTFDPDLALKHGKQYGYFYPHSEGKHFLNDPEGSLRYDGANYKNVDIYYDMYNQLLLVRNYQAGGRQYLILKQERVESFNLGGNQYYKFEVLPDTLMKAGYYRLAFERGDTQLLVKQQRELDENRSRQPGTARSSFVVADIHYLIRPSGVVIIKNKKELLQLFQNPDEIEHFLKADKIRVKPKEATFTEQIVLLLEKYPIK